MFWKLKLKAKIWNLNWKLTARSLNGKIYSLTKHKSFYLALGTYSESNFWKTCNIAWLFITFQRRQIKKLHYNSTCKTTKNHWYSPFWHILPAYPCGHEHWATAAAAPPLSVTWQSASWRQGDGEQGWPSHGEVAWVERDVGQGRVVAEVEPNWNKNWKWLFIYIYIRAGGWGYHNGRSPSWDIYMHAIHSKNKYLIIIIYRHYHLSSALTLTLCTHPWNPLSKPSLSVTAGSRTPPTHKLVPTLSPTLVPITWPLEDACPDDRVTARPRRWSRRTSHWPRGMEGPEIVVGPEPERR